jgi:hypothetical protein
MKNHSLMKRYWESLSVCLAAALGAAVMLGSTCSVLNKAPTVPVISGPSAGVVGVPVTFKATATDPESDSIAFQFDWGDTSTSAWTSPVASGETTSVQHTYSDSGTFSVKAKARDRKGKESSLSAGLALGMLAAGGDYPDSVYAEVATAEQGRTGAITPDGEYMYVAHYEDVWKVTPIRLADRTALAPVAFNAYPNDIVSSVDGTHMYVTLPGLDQVAAIRTSDNTVDRVVSVVHRPQYIAATPDGQSLLVTVAEPQPGYVVKLRAQDLTVVDSLNTGGFVGDIVVDHAGEYAYAAAPGGVQVIALASITITDSITVVPRPGRLGLSRDGRFLYVASWDDTGFAVVRLADRQLIELRNVGDQSIASFVTTPGDDYLVFSYLRGVKYVDTRTYSIVDSLVLAGETRRALVMHPTADTMYVVGFNKVYVVGPK